jgi:abequosyltransferase
MELNRHSLPIANQRPMFSICIPAYNRAHHLVALLDSIVSQDYTDFEVVIGEDMSPERKEIASIADRYIKASPGKIRFIENDQNLGYDGNIRNLVQLAEGQYCFFMGNDDLMCDGALSIAADAIARHDNVGFVLRSYAWFDEVPEHYSGEVRYFTEERVFAPGKEAISICFRRSGVISGYIVHRDSAQAAATDKFEGSLYYQMHLTVSVLSTRSAVSTPHILVLCRNNEPPDFGNSAREKGRFVPGTYTPEARLRMIGGALSILKYQRDSGGIDLVDPVMRDYANYFYPYVRDQLDLPIGSYFRLYRGYASMGFWRYPMFHLYAWLCYCFKQRGFDALVKFIRGTLGRSPQFGVTR